MGMEMLKMRGCWLALVLALALSLGACGGGAGPAAGSATSEADAAAAERVTEGIPAVPYPNRLEPGLETGMVFGLEQEKGRRLARTVKERKHYNRGEGFDYEGLFFVATYEVNTEGELPRLVAANYLGRDADAAQYEKLAQSFTEAYGEPNEREENGRLVWIAPGGYALRMGYEESVKMVGIIYSLVEDESISLLADTRSREDMLRLYGGKGAAAGNLLEPEIVLGMPMEQALAGRAIEEDEDPDSRIITLEEGVLFQRRCYTIMMSENEEGGLGSVSYIGGGGFDEEQYADLQALFVEVYGPADPDAEGAMFWSLGEFNLDIRLLGIEDEKLWPMITYIMA